MGCRLGVSTSMKPARRESCAPRRSLVPARRTRGARPGCSSDQGTAGGSGSPDHAAGVLVRRRAQRLCQQLRAADTIDNSPRLVRATEPSTPSKSPKSSVISRSMTSSQGAPMRPTAGCGRHGPRGPGTRPSLSAACGQPSGDPHHLLDSRPRRGCIGIAHRRDAHPPREVSWNGSMPRARNTATFARRSATRRSIPEPAASEGLARPDGQAAASPASIFTIWYSITPAAPE